MPLNLGIVLAGAGVNVADTIVIRHSYVDIHTDDGSPGLNADSSDAEILGYTGRQSVDPRRFPAAAPKLWVVFVKEGGARARLWSLLENRGEIARSASERAFDLVPAGILPELNGRLVVGWSSPRAWWARGSTAMSYPVLEIADAAPIPFPGFDALILNYSQLQAVMREHRDASWRTALSAVVGIYLITDTRDGRHYVGKADGAESISQRWRDYATNGHGGNVGLRGLDPSGFRFSLLRVFDPSTPTSIIDAAESHFKSALDSRRFGLNRN